MDETAWLMSYVWVPQIKTEFSHRNVKIMLSCVFVVTHRNVKIMVSCVFVARVDLICHE